MILLEQIVRWQCATCHTRFCGPCQTKIIRHKELNHFQERMVVPGGKTISENTVVSCYHVRLQSLPVGSERFKNCDACASRLTLSVHVCERQNCKFAKSCPIRHLLSFYTGVFADCRGHDLSIAYDSYHMLTCTTVYRETQCCSEINEDGLWRSKWVAAQKPSDSIWQGKTSLLRDFRSPTAVARAPVTPREMSQSFGKLVYQRSM